MSNTESAAVAVEPPSGIDLDKLKLKLVMAAAEETNVKTDGSTMDQIVTDLQAYYQKTAKQVARCGNCGGISDIELAACPFCGDEGEEEEAAPAPPPAAKPKAVKEPKEKKAKPEAAVLKSTEVDTKVSAAAEEPKSTAIALVKKPSSTAILHTDDLNAAALDEATEKILTLKRSAQMSYWQLGRAIAHVFETGLWKMRVEVDGKVQSQKYKAWEQYCDSELEITSATTYSMMKVSKAFTEAQVEKIGGTKLNIVLQAPDVEIPEIMKEVEKGAKVTQIKEQVKKAREKHGVKKKHVEGHKKMPTNAGGAKKSVTKATPEDGRITVALVAGKVKLEMFAKPKTKPKDGETLKPAKKIEDGALAVEELSNGVTRYYSLVRGPKGLRLEIETKRV